MQNSHTPSPPAVVKSYIQTLDARQPQSALAQESRLPDFAAASMMAGISLQHLLPFDIACEQVPYILLVSNLHVLNVCISLQPLHSMALLIMKEKILLRF